MLNPPLCPGVGATGFQSTDALVAFTLIDIPLVCTVDFGRGNEVEKKSLSFA